MAGAVRKERRMRYKQRYVSVHALYIDAWKNESVPFEEGIFQGYDAVFTGEKNRTGRMAKNYRKEEERRLARREARERVMQALYAYELSRDDVEHIINTQIRPFLEGNRDALQFAIRLFLTVLDHKEELDELIRKHIEHWDFERVALIDRILMRMAVAEFLYFEDIPPKVSINEALEIAKKYSTEDSNRFINGILDAVFEELEEAGRIHKTGKGLIGWKIPEPTSKE